MKRYYIEYQTGREVKSEYVVASTYLRAIRVLTDKIRQVGRPVHLKVITVKQVQS